MEKEEAEERSREEHTQISIQPSTSLFHISNFSPSSLLTLYGGKDESYETVNLLKSQTNSHRHAQVSFFSL